MRNALACNNRNTKEVIYISRTFCYSFIEGLLYYTQLERQVRDCLVVGFTSTHVCQCLSQQMYGEFDSRP